MNWLVPAIFTHPGNNTFKPAWWRGEAPATLPEFFYDLDHNVYYDRIGGCWGMPVYRQRLTACSPPADGGG